MKKTNENTSVNNLDDYISKLEKQEKYKTRNRGVLFLGLSAILFLGFALVKFAFPDRSLQIYHFNDLDSDFLSDLAENEQLPILVNHPELGTDTIFNLDDYTTLLSLSYSLEVNKGLKVSDETNIISSDEENSSVNKIPFLGLDIIGNREKGNKLKFVVENFDPEINYEIDFGNGYKTKMKKAATYTYQKSGNYRIKLIANRADQNQIYTKKIRIEKRQEQIAERGLKNESKSEKQEIPEVPASPELKVSEIEEPLDENIEENISESPIEIQNLQIPNSVEEKIEPQATSPTPIASEITSDKEISTETLEESFAPLAFAQLMPEYPGGPAAFSKFMRKNYRYPQKAVNYGIEGVVSVRFIVNPDGSLSNPYVIKGIGYGCDEEAIRLVSKMPSWIPGENSGKKVAVYQTIPVTFRLEN